MSSLVIASKRFQSVCDFCEVSFFFIFRSFASGNDPNHLSGFRVDDHHYDPIEQAECDEAILAIIKAVIQDDHRFSVKQRLQIGKVNAVILDVGLAFGFIPLKFYFE